MRVEGAIDRKGLTVTSGARQRQLVDLERVFGQFIDLKKLRLDNGLPATFILPLNGLRH